jgi:predicted Zn-dependent peptidase
VADVRRAERLLRDPADGEDPAAAAQALATARATLSALAAAQPSAAEFEQARREAAARLNANKPPDIVLADQWLDAESYSPAAAETLRTLSTLTPADAERVAARLFRDANVATVAVGPAAELRAELTRTTNGIEIFGAPAPPPTPARRP